jgi:hypothetical protein
MHTKTKTQAQTRTKKPFQWGISSSTISFMQLGELEAARDGSTSDCSKISPLPLPRRQEPGRGAGRK